VGRRRALPRSAQHPEHSGSPHGRNGDLQYLTPAATDLDVVELPPFDEVHAPVARPGPPPRSPGWLRALAVHLAVIGAFTLPAVFLWWNAWRTGAASTVRCPCLDPGQQVWFLAWPTYALTHGMNPFATTWLWPPRGVNLLDNASAPLVGLVLSPITWLFGPFVTTTLALTLAPGLSAWGCWMACRRFVSWKPACWVGGFLFGYSPFVVESVAQGHLSTGLLVLPPLMLVLLHEILVRQQRSAVWCGVALGALLGAQILISAEVLTMMVLIAVVGIAAAAALAPRRVVPALPFALRAFGVAALVGAALLMWPVWFIIAGPQHINGSVWSSLHDLFVAQAWELWSAGPVHSVLFPGALQGPQLQFVGYGVLAAAAVSVAVAWRRRAVWVMAIVAAVSTVLSWGGILWLSPDHSVLSHWLPWSWFTNLAVLSDINAIHFSALADLAVAVVVAVGLDALHLSRPWGRLPAAGRVVTVGGAMALMLVPIWATYGAPLAVQPVGLPQWYATVARHVPEGSVITSYPFPASASVTSEPLVWQAADGMRFRLAGGYVKVPSGGTGVLGTGRPDSATETLDELTLAAPAGHQRSPVTADQLQKLRSALKRWHTSYIVVADRGAVPTEAAGVFTAATGRLPRITHRAWVWNLRTRSLRSPYDAVAASDALAACRSVTGRLHKVPTDEPLPQTLNRCVAAGIDDT
jgi:hypothetical protein